MNATIWRALIGAMSSDRDSLANNDNGAEELYRISKAAPGMSMRRYAACGARTARSPVPMALGRVRTEQG